MVSLCSLDALPCAATGFGLTRSARRRIRARRICLRYVVAAVRNPPPGLELEYCGKVLSGSTIGGKEIEYHNTEVDDNSKAKKDDTMKEIEYHNMEVDDNPKVKKDDTMKEREYHNTEVDDNPKFKKDDTMKEIEYHKQRSK